MTDNEIIGGIVAMLGSTVGTVVPTVKWAVSRMIKAHEETTLRVIKALDDNTASKIEFVKAATRLELKIDQVARWVEENTPVEVPIPQERSQKYRFPRKKTDPTNE